MRMAKARSKYGNVRTTVDGVTFASKREAVRWRELRLLEQGKTIHSLQRQVPFPLHVGQAVKQPIGTYIADFVYGTSHGETIVEDVKGYRTALYRWKRKHVKAEYGIEIQEV